MNAISIKEALENIKNNKYVIPAFQRNFVWGFNQIEKLWDSILLDYPISTFLFWKVNQNNSTETTRFRTFIQDCYFNSSKKSKRDEYTQVKIDFNVTDTAVLDGQQRLTALYLSLYGKLFITPKRARTNKDATECQLVIELDNTKLDIEDYDSENRAYNAKQYDIRIVNRVATLSPTQFEIKKIMSPEFQNDETRNNAIEYAISGVSIESKDYARNILNTLYSKICVEKLINYTELSDTTMLFDAVEVFVRFNSAGENLKRYEITTAILETYWPGCKEAFEEVLGGAYKGFGEDFIIRTALMLFSDNVVKSSIDQKTADLLKNNWEQFKEALNNMEKILNKFSVDLKRFASGWNVLLPAIYAIYYNSENTKKIELQRNMFVYIVRAVLFKYFNSGTTSKLSSLCKELKDNNFKFDLNWLNAKRELAPRDSYIEDILNTEKNDKVAGEALFYLNRLWINPSLTYELDHLHPYSLFDAPIYGVSNEKWIEWRAIRNRLPNLWPLNGTDNGSKNNEPLIDYYNDKTAEQQIKFMDQAIIPENISLELSDFGTFYEKRKELLYDKLTELLNGTFSLPTEDEEENEEDA